MSLREALEGAVFENPDDLAPHMAYGDLLSEQGDPRGEFIQVQLALEDPSRPAQQRKELQAREAELLDAHAAEWLGDAAPAFLESEPDKDEELGIYGSPERFEFTFRRGWLYRVVLGDCSERLLAALDRAPTSPLLRELVIHGQNPEEPCLDALGRLRCAPGLRLFQLGQPDDNPLFLDDEEPLVPAIARMAHLEELALYPSDVRTRALFALPLPRLRSLTVHHQMNYPLDVLAANPAMASLVTLRLWPHAFEYDDEAYITARGFIALVNSPHLKSLANIHLYLSDIGDEGVRALVESGRLGQLRILDLWNGRISDVGARVLAGAPGLRDLQLLRLTKNNLSDAGIAALVQAGARLEADDQYSASQIAANEHLWEGEIE